MSEKHRTTEEAAQAARQAGMKVANLVHEKQLAYGDASGKQRALWAVLLDEYRTEDGQHYRIPVALMDHVPRLTRLFDRVARLVHNPEGDRFGEDPWLDMAGDCVVGMVMPRTERGTGDAEVDGATVVHVAQDGSGYFP